MIPTGPKKLPYRPTPLHWGCRSFQAPKTKSWKDLGVDLDELPPLTRHSMDGELPANLTAEEWLRTKDLPFLSRIFGVGRARLFLEGGLPIEDMIDQRGRPMPLYKLLERGSNPVAAYLTAGTSEEDED